MANVHLGQPPSPETLLAGGSIDVAIVEAGVEQVALLHRRPPTMNETLQIHATMADHRVSHTQCPFSVVVIEPASYANLLAYGVIDTEYNISSDTGYLVFIENLNEPTKFERLLPNDERVLNHIGVVRHSVSGRTDNGKKED